MTRCTICNQIVESDKARHHDIYVIGSEGVWLCYECEMALVNYLRAMQSMATRSKLTAFKEAKKREVV
jgi:hypothetical protein